VCDFAPEETELYRACLEEPPDWDRIGSLLALGTDPLEYIYGELLCDLAEEECGRLFRITELFLRHGMDIDRPRIPYDGENILNPMWSFAFFINGQSLYLLKLLLDSGLSAQSAGLMWTHAVSDALDAAKADPNSEPCWRDTFIRVVKMLLLCASYDHILNNDRELRQLIGCGCGLHRFRRWDDYIVVFDRVHCEDRPGSCPARIRDKKSGQTILEFVM